MFYDGGRFFILMRGWLDIGVGRLLYSSPVFVLFEGRLDTLVCKL